jgi:uncharacterized membrane protein
MAVAPLKNPKLATQLTDRRPAGNNPVVGGPSGNSHSVEGGKDHDQNSRLHFCLFAALTTAVHLPVLAQSEGSSGSHKAQTGRVQCSGGGKKSSKECAPSCGTFSYATHFIDTTHHFAGAGLRYRSKKPAA